MRELYHLIRTEYESVRGEGLPALFAVSLLILFLKGRKQLFAFILSVPTCIVYALTLLVTDVSKFKITLNKKGILSFTSISLAVIVLILSGGRIISDDFFGPAENTLHIRTSYVMVMDRLLSLGKDESVIEVIAPPGLSPYLKPYSSKFMPLYEYPGNGSGTPMTESARIVYDQFQSSVPDMKKITDAAKKEGIEYIVIDTGNYYPELKASEFGYELSDEADSWEIYRRIDP